MELIGTQPSLNARRGKATYPTLTGYPRGKQACRVEAFG